MLSELRTRALLGIPYERGKGVVFHDTRHSAVTNLVDYAVWGHDIRARQRFGGEEGQNAGLRNYLWDRALS